MISLPSNSRNKYHSGNNCCRFISFHNGRDGVSNHQPDDCLLNCLLTRRSKTTTKLRLCVGNSPVTGEFPAQRASNAENVSISWRHHVLVSLCKMLSTTVYLCEGCFRNGSTHCDRVTLICVDQLMCFFVLYLLTLVVFWHFLPWISNCYRDSLHIHTSLSNFFVSVILNFRITICVLLNSSPRMPYICVSESGQHRSR